MKSQITSVAAALLLMSAPEMVDARKQLVGADNERLLTRASPLVGSDQCEEQCLMGRSSEEKVFWCFTFTEPVSVIGWEYNQDANTDQTSTPNKHLRFDLLFYLTNHLQVTSTMDIFRLYYNQSMFEIPQIDMKLDWGAIFNELG